MVVIARGRNEAVIIDGTIRVEVLRLAGDLARLRLQTPKDVPVQRGVAKAGDPAAIEAINGGIDATGMGVVELTLASQHVITIGEEFHVGLLDIAAGRAVLFLDVPCEVSVTTEDAGPVRPRLRAKGEARGQRMLPFPNTSAGEPPPSTIPFVRPGDRDEEG
jgi:sRNA-binding carbon storage regulator CsrA